MGVSRSAAKWLAMRFAPERIYLAIIWRISRNLADVELTVFGYLATMQFASSLIRFLPLSIAYFASASLALSLTRFDGGVAFLWVAASLLIATLASIPRRLWAAPLTLCGAASFLATGLFGLGWSLAVQFMIVNVAEAWIAAWLLRRTKYKREQLGSIDWMVHFVASAGVAAPLVAAGLAGAVLAIDGRPAITGALQVYTGHALGNITFIPIMGLLLGGKLKQSMRLTGWPRFAEMTALICAVAITTLTVFRQTSYPLLFLPMLPIILATFRLGQGGAALSVVILAVVGGGLTMWGYGPISLIGVPPGTAMQFFQFFLAATVLTVLPVAADLNNRARLHRNLRLSEERYRLLADHSTDIMMHLELDGRIRFVSPSIRQLGGYEPDDLAGKNATIMIAPEYADRVREAHLATLAAAGKTYSYEYEAITSEGQRRWYETHSRAVIDEENGDIDGVLCFVRDVSARKATELQLTQAAMTDALTGLPNRRALREAAKQLLARSAHDNKHCLAVFDIDHFKQVNDRYGHDGGDAVLRRFGEVARGLMRETDIIARIGGEEFAALLPKTSVEEALIICERLRLAVAKTPIAFGNDLIRITTSGGVATLSEAGIDLAYKQADAALYRAKEAGRDQLYLAA